MGVSASAVRNLQTMSSTSRIFVPAFSDRCAAFWIAGPSAIGSEKGMPSSMMSAWPASWVRISKEASGPGSPAMT